MLRTRENSVVFNSLDEMYLVFTKKKANILYVFIQSVDVAFIQSVAHLGTIYVAHLFGRFLKQLHYKMHY